MQIDTNKRVPEFLILKFGINQINIGLSGDWDVFAKLVLLRRA